MNITNKRMHLIAYGKGNALDIARFKPVRNQDFFVKPRGGFWASPVDSLWGWRDWCKAEDFGDLSSSFAFEFSGRILTIDSVAHAMEMPWLAHNGTIISVATPDFEKMDRDGIDAIHLTEAGQTATRFSNPSLRGWDCECVLIMNPAGIISLPASSNTTKKDNPK